MGTVLGSRPLSPAVDFISAFCLSQSVRLCLISYIHNIHLYLLYLACTGQAIPLDKPSMLDRRHAIRVRGSLPRMFCCLLWTSTMQCGLSRVPGLSPPRPVCLPAAPSTSEDLLHSMKSPDRRSVLGMTFSDGPRAVVGHASEPTTGFS